MNVLRQHVLVLNSVWQAIGETDVETALTDCAKGARTAIDTEFMLPLRWEDWIKLPVREGDLAIRTVKFAVRVPTVIVASTYDRMPKKHPRLGRRGVGQRDNYTCGYTGVHCPDGNLDHVVPRDQGGKDTWENLVWSDRRVNTEKANRTPEQAGLKLRRKPFKPQPVPVMLTIEPKHPDWEHFLIRRS